VKEEAQTAITQGPLSQEVMNLCINPTQVYIKLAQSKIVRERFKRMKQRDYVQRQHNVLFGGRGRNMP
jgi:hypothetical protein